MSGESPGRLALIRHGESRSTLTSAELDAIRLLAGEKSYRQIARALDTSESTVDNQLRMARCRTSVNSSAELNAHANKRGSL